jgi:hypothetical protein
VDSLPGGNAVCMSDLDDEKAGPQIVPDTPVDTPPTPSAPNEESEERREAEHGAGPGPQRGSDDEDR